MRNLNRVIAVLVLSFIFLGCESTLYWLKLNQKALFWPILTVYTFIAICTPGGLKKLELFSKPWNGIITAITVFVGLGLLGVGIFKL